MIIPRLLLLLLLLGNHYCEIQVVDEIYDVHAAARMGIDKIGEILFLYLIITIVIIIILIAILITTISCL